MTCSSDHLDDCVAPGVTVEMAIEQRGYERGLREGRAESALPNGRVESQLPRICTLIGCPFYRVVTTEYRCPACFCINLIDHERVAANAVAAERAKVVAYLKTQCQGHVSQSGSLPRDIEEGKHLIER